MVPSILNYRKVISLIVLCVRSWRGSRYGLRKEQLRVPTVGWLPRWVTPMKTPSQRRLWLFSHFSPSHFLPLLLLSLITILPFAFPFNLANAIHPPSTARHTE